jgi:DNA-binding beta-propeller fold protein YncE
VSVSVYRPVSRSLVWLYGVIIGGPGAASGRLPRRTFTVLALGVAALFACAFHGVFPAAAQAEPTKLISYGSFGTQQFAATGVAVEGSGDLFVSGLLGERFARSPVVKLDPSGKLLSPPSPFGSAHYSGVAVNPANGDVYVLGEEGFFTPAQIFVYDPNTGALLSSFEVSASRNAFETFTDVQIAADSAGDVYVPVVPENKVLEYSPSGTLLKTFTGSSSGPLKEPTAVAIDSSGDLWVADSGNARIVELDSNGAPVEVNGKPVEFESLGVWSVALDGHGDMFALVDNSADPCGEKSSPCLHLIEYSLEGRQLADVGAGFFGASGGEEEHFYSGIAVNQANGRVYVAAGLQGTVWLFGPPTAPVVDKQLTAEIGTSEVKLGALVNPGGLAATYRFEYGPTSAYGSSTPFPEGSVGEGLTARAVWAAASGLGPGTTYHYRVVATNELGTAYGPDQTFTTLTAEEAACPNELLRGGFAERLPDCRAYELVTLPPQTSTQFDASNRWAYASTVAADGEAVSLLTTEPLPGAPASGIYYVATRGAGGWLAQDIMPIESYEGVGCPEYAAVFAYSSQLSRDVILDGGGSRASEETPEDPESCNPEGRQIVSGEPVGYENLLVRDNATGTYQLVNVAPPGVTPADAHFQAASADLSHVFFTETSPLAQGAQYGVENLYEWDEGAVRLVSVLPDGTAVPGSLAAETGTHEHEAVVSSDGTHDIFTYGGALYDRIDGQHTVQIDEKQGGSGVSGGGSLQAATSDGSKVFFLDENKLTPGSTAETGKPGEPDLYECEIVEQAGKLTCKLIDLTVAKAGEHADVLRVTPLGRQDSSYVFFVAKGVLASNTREFTDSEGKTVVEGAEAGQQNLYLWNGEKTTFVASGIDDNGTSGIEQTSPDGKWLAFESKKSLNGYDNVKPNGFPADELFLYSAGSGSHPPTLACASCNPAGEAAGEEGGVVPPARGFEGAFNMVLSRRLLTDAGRVFFDAKEALVPSDTNGQLDVYEYESGHVYLISSGTSSFESNLQGASESGRDVFFRSNQALVPQDVQEGMIVIYDARVDGGFPAPASPPPCTTADACRTPVLPQPSLYGAPSSQTFSGVGNLTPTSQVTPHKKAKPKRQKVRKRACKHRNKHKRARCAGRAHKTRVNAKSHKGGK